MSVHELKILPEYYKAIESGRKIFEVRKNDRDFKVGDTVILREWDRDYTGNELKAYILDDKNYCKEGYVIFGISRPEFNNLDIVSRWEESISEEELEELASNYYAHNYSMRDEINYGVSHVVIEAYKAGYRKAKEE